VWSFRNTYQSLSLIRTLVYEVYCYYILVSSNQLVQSIAIYCVMFGRYRSFLGPSALLCCDRYNWSLSELISNLEHIKYFPFKFWHFNGWSHIQKISAGSFSDLIAIRVGQLCLPPLFFSTQRLGDNIDYLCTSWLIYALFGVLCTFATSVYIILVLDLCTWSTNNNNNNNRTYVRPRKVANQWEILGIRNHFVSVIHLVLAAVV